MHTLKYTTMLNNSNFYLLEVFMINPKDSNIHYHTDREAVFMVWIFCGCCRTS